MGGEEEEEEEEAVMVVVVVTAAKKAGSLMSVHTGASGDCFVNSQVFHKYICMYIYQMYYNVYTLSM